MINVCINAHSARAETMMELNYYSISNLEAPVVTYWEKNHSESVTYEKVQLHQFGLSIPISTAIHTMLWKSETEQYGGMDSSD